MADLPRNLDECELYLPSDIYPDEIYYKNSAKFSPDENYHKSSSKVSPVFPSQLTYVEELAQQVAAYNKLNQNGTVAAKPLPNLITNLKPFGPATGFSIVSPQERGYGFGAFTPAGQSFSSFSNGGFRTGSRAVPQHCKAKPAHSQIDRFVHARGRVLQSQRSQNQNQNRLLPFQASSLGASGFGKEYRGTGVFLPRVVHADISKKPNVNGGEQRQAMANVDGVMKQGMTIQAPLQMGDWTYY